MTFEPETLENQSNAQ